MRWIRKDFTAEDAEIAERRMGAWENERLVRGPSRDAGILPAIQNHGRR